jgi:protein TonB
MQYVELTFGTADKTGSAGAVGTQIEKIEEVSKPKPKNETQEKNLEVKEVKLPVAKNTFEDNNVKPAEKEKKVTPKTETKTEKSENSDVSTEGQGNKAEGTGSFGYDIDWGGKGKREIYSYTIPAYPEGVQKEIDIKLKFAIMPDGTVSTVIPLTKADTKLENAAINSLKQWRFEPLSPQYKQIEQVAVIVFPYRLK